MKPLLNASRYLVLSAVIGSLLSATALYTYGLIDTVLSIAHTITEGNITNTGAKALMLHFIKVFDLFLLGTVMLILAFSLYELFIDPDFKLASRLNIHSFDDLKTTLVTIVIAVMSVTFLGHVMAWEGDTNLLNFGIAVAVVILALNVYLWVMRDPNR